MSIFCLYCVLLVAKPVFFLFVSFLFRVAVSCVVLNLRLSLLFGTNFSTLAGKVGGATQIVTL
jgi:hypothetical protein